MSCSAELSQAALPDIVLIHQCEAKYTSSSFILNSSGSYIDMDESMYYIHRSGYYSKKYPMFQGES